MKRYFTLMVLELLAMNIMSAADDDKPCKSYYCSDYDWYHNKGRFDPHTIHWPLHYTGEVYRDYVDGGHHHIEIEHGHGKSYRSTLRDYRKLPECPHYDYMKSGIKMPDPFECKAHTYDEPKWKESSCSDIAAGYEDQVVHVDGPSCSKILRKWTIIDWCKWKPNTRANTYKEKYVLVHDRYKDKSYFAYGHGKHDVEHDGYYTFTQVIKIVDRTKPELVSCEDLSYKVPAHKCEAQVKLHNTIKDGGPCPGEKMAVEVTVKDYDEEVVVEKWFHAFHDQEFGESIGFLDAGHYTVHWNFKDGCGNSNHCIQKLVVEDKNPPHLLCIKDLSTSISDDYGVSIWAEDFVHKLSSKCMTDDIKISFDPVEHETSRHFDCNEDLGIQQLTVYATDAKGNQASCNVELFISDHNDCTGDQQVGGIVMDRDRDPIEGVDVNVYQGDAMISTSASDRNGYYNIKDVPLEKSIYTIQPTLDDFSKDGLNETDLLLILRHLTDVQDFDEVLEYGAADVNSDGTLTLDDYWDLAAIIYDLPGRDVSHISPWKFFDAKKYNGFRGRASALMVPIPIKEFKRRYDIMGIKVGDVDFSLARNKSSKSRSGRLLRTTFSETVAQNMNRIDINLPHEQDKYGLVLKLENINTKSIESVYADGRQLQFITRRLGADIELTIASETLIVGNQISIYTSAKSNVAGTGLLVTRDGENLQMDDLQLSKISAESDLQAYPSPFSDQLEIAYTAPKAATARLEIFALDGRNIFMKNIGLNQGQNIIQLNTETFNNGIYMLRIAHDDQSKVVRVTKARP